MTELEQQMQAEIELLERERNRLIEDLVHLRDHLTDADRSLVLCLNAIMTGTYRR